MERKRAIFSQPQRLVGSFSRRLGIGRGGVPANELEDGEVEWLEVGVEDEVDELGEAAALEGRLAGAQLVGDAAERPEVRLEAVDTALLEELGGHVVGGAALAHLDVGAESGGDHIDEAARVAEIRELGDAVLVEEDV